MSQNTYQPGAGFQSGEPAEVVEPTNLEDEFADFIDTYSFGGTLEYVLPDGRQRIFYRVMNEGQKAEFERSTSRDIKVDRKTNSAAFRPDVATDRHALVLASVVDWSLYTKNASTQKWERMTFNRAMLQNWLAVTNPKYVEELEKAIRKANPWLGESDLSADDLREQIADLQEQLAERLSRDAGKGN